MKRKLVSAVLLSAILTGGASASYANTAPTPTPSATSTQAPAATDEATDKATDAATDKATDKPSISDAPSALGSIEGSSYDSLSAAMTSYYAESKGMTLEDFVSKNPAEASGLLGVSIDTLKTMPTDDTATLTQSMKLQGATLDMSAYKDMESAKLDLLSKGNTLDAVITTAGASYAEQLAALRAPTLKAPGMPVMDTSMANSMPTESLAFGLFLNKSLTDLVTNSPDVFTQIQASGVGTPEAQAAWKNSMMNAMGNSKGDLTSMLPSKCGGVFLTAMASGSAAEASKNAPSKDCGTCMVSGLYSHGQMSKIFDPTASSLTPARDTGYVREAEWLTMDSWQRNALTNSNPQLGATLDNVLAIKDKNLQTSCGTGSAGVKQTAGSSIGKTLGFLNR